MSETLANLQNVLRSALAKTVEDQREAWVTIEKELGCPDCGWNENKNRYRPSGLGEISDRLRVWVEKAHCHFMRHVYWTRFGYSKRFCPPVTPEEKKEQAKLAKRLDLLTGAMTIEICYPSETEDYLNLFHFKIPDDLNSA
jgi:hypothetical protein